MIAALLSDVASRVDGADAVAKTDETITLTIDARGIGRSALSTSSGAQLRVLKGGRIGWHGGSGADPASLVEGALASALDGERIAYFLPARAPLADVITHDAGTASASVADLWALTRSVAEQLAGPGREVEVWLERSSGTVAVGNTRGVDAKYPVTLAGLGARVRSPNAPPVDLHLAGGTLPTPLEVDQMVRAIERRVSPPTVEPVELGSAPVLFRPRAARALLQPLLAALTGDPGPVGGPLAVDFDQAQLDSCLTLIDDPLVPLRPGSRPIDDDGVPALRLRLIDRGRVRARLLDLLAGSRRSLPSTGHAWRAVLGAPRVGATNLRLLPTEGAPDPLGSMERGLVIEDLSWSAAPNAALGNFVLRAPWAYWVERGEVIGRREGTVLAGNAFQLLRRVIAIGGDATWVGAACVPSIAVDGVRVGLGAL